VSEVPPLVFEDPYECKACGQLWYDGDDCPRCGEQRSMGPIPFSIERISPSGVQTSGKIVPGKSRRIRRKQGGPA
jgi:hypothetical protein